MSIYLRFYMMLPVFLFSDPVNIVIDSGDINTLGLSLAKQCSWSWIKSESILESFDLDVSYNSCSEALEDLSSLYDLKLEKNKLFVDDYSFYKPEFMTVSSIKKQIKTWLGSKVFKKLGFFDESGILFLNKNNEKLVKSLDVPLKQLHLRAILWISDQREQQHLSLNYDKIMSFEKWLNKLSAMQQEGLVKILAQPELYMLVNKKALVYSGEEIPYISKDSKKSNVLFKKALLSMMAKALHIGENSATIEVELTFDKPSEHYYNGNVAIARQKVKTTLRIPFNTSRVMGGVSQYRHSFEENCWPIVGKIPVLKHVFCESALYEKKSLLYVMLIILPVLDV